MKKKVGKICTTRVLPHYQNYPYFPLVLYNTDSTPAATAATYREDIIMALTCSDSILAHKGKNGSERMQLGMGGCQRPTVRAVEESVVLHSMDISDYAQSSIGNPKCTYAISYMKDSMRDK